MLETVAFIGAALGLILVLAGMRRLRRRQVVSGSGEGAVGVCLIGGAALLGAVALNLHTYQRLTAEGAVAELQFEGLAPQHYAVVVSYPRGAGERYELRGDEWQIDARILKWHGVATLLGFEPAFRLERLSGRYSSLEDERTAKRSVHGLSREAGFDLWGFARRHNQRLPWVDAVYGSATYMPMRDGARFAVTVSPTGLVARPANREAREAVTGWNSGS